VKIAILQHQIGKGAKEHGDLSLLFTNGKKWGLTLSQEGKCSVETQAIVAKLTVIYSKDYVRTMSSRFPLF
jgi:hypothetical protein